MTILETIIAHKRLEVEARKRKTSQQSLVRRLSGAPAPGDFRSALVTPGRPAPRVIAEIKRRSPSKGALRADLDPVELGRIYEQNGAAAISVLTDAKYFGGSMEDLRAVREAVDIPVLCKEFIFDPYQVIEARIAGADAILLIAGVVTTVDLSKLRQLAANLGMAALVEVHDRSELGHALAAGADIIGINNRNLHTFEVSLAVTEDLLPLVPADAVTVSESGIKSPADREHLASLGVHALLVGESLLTAPDAGSATRVISGLASPVLETSLL